MQSVLSSSFYCQSDVVSLAKELVGCKLETRINGCTASGIITETEAYAHAGDQACHAHLGRRTKTNAAMYEVGGTAYVYLCYGIHHLFNVVTNLAGTPDAVLIRAIQPLEGIETMQKRRKYPKNRYTLSTGPGNLTQALGISQSHNLTSLTTGPLRIYKAQNSFEETNLLASPRVGIDYAGEDAFLPWRFRLKHTKWTSKPH